MGWFFSLWEMSCMVEISKQDWKMFRERIPGWQERYMERLIREYIDLLSSSENAADRFWALEKRIRQDKKHLGVQIQMRRSTAIWDIATCVGDEVITMDELDGFSEDLIDAVKLILSR